MRVCKKRGSGISLYRDSMRGRVQEVKPVWDRTGRVEVLIKETADSALVLQRALLQKKPPETVITRVSSG